MVNCSAQDGPVGEYKLPFEEDVGLHPSLDEMQECVVTRKTRPRIPSTWLHHPVSLFFLMQVHNFNNFCSLQGLVSVVQMMQESWDHDAEARLSASCIVERFGALAKHVVS